MALIIITILFTIYDIANESERNLGTVSVMVILSVSTLASFCNLICILIYYLVVVEMPLRRCTIQVSKQENRIHLAGFGLASKYLCGCLFARSVYLEDVTLKNAFIQVRCRHAAHQRCSCTGDSLDIYLRGYDAMLNENDPNQQIEVQEESTLCHQQWNQGTDNVLKNVLTYDERKWIVHNLIQNSHCALVKSVDNDSDEFSLVLPSNDRGQVIDL